MKVNILKNKAGRVIASFEAEANTGLRLAPQVAKGQKLEQLEVPNDYRSRLDVVYKTKSTRK